MEEISRREMFEKLLLILAVLLLGSYASYIFNPSEMKLQQYKSDEKLIAEALQSEDGRVALARAMSEPIRRSLNYEAFGRKVLMVN